MNVLVMVPVDVDQATSLWQGTEPEGVQGFTANARLRETVGIDDAQHQKSQGEDAEYACLVLASIWGLATHGRRLVLAAELPGALLAEGEEADNGGVLVTRLPRRAVTSFFTDQHSEGADSLVQRAREACRGMDLDAAWETEQVQALVQGSDLLWHSADELATLDQA